MIIGNGLLANAFRGTYGDRGDIMIFASGVSNSAETDPAQFLREETLLRQCVSPHITTVYFSSCAVATDETSAYIDHKRKMEELVLKVPGNLVIRLPQVVGRSNSPSTISNYIVERIRNDEPFEIWIQAERNLIDVEHVVSIAEAMIDQYQLRNQVATIATDRNVTVLKIVNALERILGKRANVTKAVRGESLPIDRTLSLAIARKLGIEFDDGYLERTLRRYYEHD